MIDDGPVVWKSMGLSLRKIISTATIFRIACAFMAIYCFYVFYL
jgi:hypothetical protein